MSLVLRQQLNGSRLIVAFDGLKLKTSRKSIKDLAPIIAGGKATELIEYRGAGALDRLDLSIRFLDAKLHDIGATMQRRVSLYASKADLVTVHLSSGEPALREAVKEASLHNIGIVGVTLLTSLSPANCRAIYNSNIKEQVTYFARLARMTGVFGIVCSAHENYIVRREFPKAVIFNPGIRSSSALTHDQARVASPAEAIQMGADYIICGRQVLQEPTPAKRIAMVMRINEEIATARRNLLSTH